MKFSRIVECIEPGVIIGLAVCSFYGLQMDVPTTTNMEPGTKVINSMAAADGNADMAKIAFIIGASGEVGSALLKEVLERQIFSTVRLLGRRNIDIPDVKSSTAVEQFVVDFDNLDQNSEAFANASAGFCCLGTTRAKAGKEGFIRVDRDYVVNSAKQAKASGVEHLVIVSSQGTNKNSMFLYPQTKGLMEEDVKELGLPAVTVFRPGLLVVDRKESRLFERFLIKCANPVMNTLFPQSFSIPVPTLARAMVNVMTKPIPSAFNIIENKDIFKIAE